MELEAVLGEPTCDTGEFSVTAVLGVDGGLNELSCGLNCGSNYELMG